MVDRIRQLLQARQLSPTQFADTIGVARPIVSHILGGRNKPSLEVVQKIIAAFPDVALPWLLSGQGNMLAAPAATTAPEPSSAPPDEAPTARPSRRPARGSEAPVKPAQETPPPPATNSLPDPAVVAVEPRPTPQIMAGPNTAPDSALGPALAPLLTTSAKTIRRVLIFYNDGTFADFSPSQDGF